MELIPLDKFEGLLRADLDHDKSSFGAMAWSDALGYWVARRFIGLEGADLKRACAMQGPGDSGVDLFWALTGKRQVFIGQAEASENLNLNRRFSRTILQKLRRALSALNDPKVASNRRSPLFEAAKEYQEARKAGHDVTLWAIVAGRPDEGLVREADRFNRVDLAMHPHHKLEILDAGALLARYCAEVQNLPYPDVKLELEDGESFGHGKDALFASITANSLAEAVKHDPLRIFESNARLPLLTAEVNREIAETLKDPDSRPAFWHFNNGLTILCDDYELKDGWASLKGAQIVNGCQTAHTVSTNSGSLEGVSIPAKIVRKVESDLMDKIRRATNRQTHVTERDLRSGDLVQKVLQRDFQAKGYFYQRKRVEYQNVMEQLGRPHVTREFPNGLIDNVDLAQCSLAFWHQRPSSAKMEKKMIFVKKNERREDLPGGYYDRVFHDGVSAEEMLLPSLIRDYLYNKLKVGFHGHGLPKGEKYQVLTHGNHAILAGAGRILMDRYSVKPSRVPVVLSRFVTLNRIFGEASEESEFLARFDEVMETMILALRRFVRAELIRRRTEGLTPDVRDILVADTTFKAFADGKEFQRVIAKSRKVLPALA